MREELAKRGKALIDDTNRLMAVVRKGGNGPLIAAEVGALADRVERFRADAESEILKDGHG